MTLLLCQSTSSVISVELRAGIKHLLDFLHLATMWLVVGRLAFGLLLRKF